jgi:hypothetical protein
MTKRVATMAEPTRMPLLAAAAIGSSRSPAVLRA